MTAAILLIVAVAVLWILGRRLMRWLGPSPLDYQLAQARARSDAAQARPEWLAAPDRERMQP